jgi:hypothetical protein
LVNFRVRSLAVMAQHFTAAGIAVRIDAQA